jgi:hypothetical protein
MRFGGLALGGAVLLVACGGGGDPDSGVPPGDSGPRPVDAGPPPPPPSDHPIDVAIWPRLWSEGATDLTLAGEDELCRRFALELIGRVPSAAERTTLCDGLGPEAMARAMIAHPGFVERERRFWIETVGAQPVDMMATHLVDADRLYDGLARGEIEYDDFAARLVAHPVLAVGHRPALPGNEDDPKPSVNAIFRVFLGRYPTGREMPDFVNLLRPWRRAFEPRCPDDYGGWRRPAYLDPNVCPDPVLGDAACTSVELGQTVTVSIPDGAAALGFALPCDPMRPIADVYYYEQFHGGTVPAALEVELERPGRLLATRPEFWDQAAELALIRLLGWWRSTADEPDTIVPEVRRTIADWYRAQPAQDQRELYVFVLTSILATRSSETAPASGSPDARSAWSMGPTRFMDANQFLDSLEVVFSREIGLCDPHTEEPVGYTANQFLDRLRTPQPADFHGWGDDVYYEWGLALGGCRGATRPPANAGLEAIFTQADVADTICGDATATIVPAGFDPTDESLANVDAFAADLFERALLRAPTAAETAAVHEAASTCFAASDCDMDLFVRETCTAVVRSSAFTHY